MNTKDMADWYLRKVITSDFYLSKSPVKDTAILYKPFYDLVVDAITLFEQAYDYDVVIVETYRSNTLQLQYYNNGASKIKKNGMHHYSIAVDLAFKINGTFSYNGDYKYLRECLSGVGLNLLGLWDQGHVQFIPVADQTKLRNMVDVTIRQFQKENGLQIDGIIGKHTIAKAKEI